MANFDLEGVQFRALVSTIISSSTVNFASVADAASAGTDVAVVGAALGDFVLVSVGIDAEDLTVTADVTAADVVTVTLNNNTGAPVDLASTTVRLMVLSPGSVWDKT